MLYYEKISCRVAIQVCTGYFPNGRKRRWTFSMRNINPEASVEAIANVVRALAPLLINPIIKVRKVVKRAIIFVAAHATAPVTAAAPAAAVALMPVAAPVAAYADNGTPGTSSPTARALLPIILAALYIRAVWLMSRAPPADGLL